MRTDEEYIALLEQLETRLNGLTEVDNFRRIAREEAEKRIQAWMIPLGAIGVGWYVQTHYGSDWWWLFVAGLVLWFVWSVWRQGHTREYDRHLVGLYAQDICRLDHLRDRFEQGLPVWNVEDRPHRQVVADEGTHWDGWWRGVYETALALEQLTANQRDKRVRTASRAALPMLEQGEQLARSEKAELTFWARSALEKARAR